jgi:hypothetical protein
MSLYDDPKPLINKHILYNFESLMNKKIDQRTLKFPLFPFNLFKCDKSH